ncbi:ABC transporter permease [candidate division KSB1 bacterium]
MKTDYRNMPKIAGMLFYFLLPSGDYHYLIGDYEEIYNRIYLVRGPRSAYFWIWMQIFKSLPLYVCHSFYWSTVMLKNYFKLSYRSLVRDKLFGTISIFSLSIAIGASLSIFVLIALSFEFDSFHENAEQIYLVENIINRNGEIAVWGDSPVALGAAIKADLPQIKDVVRIEQLSGTIRRDEEVFNETLCFADNGFFNMFTFPLIQGDKRALSERNAVFFTEKTAKKYFGDKDPLGEHVEIVFSDREPSVFYVRGVVKELPLTTSIIFDILISYDNIFNDEAENYWKSFTDATFIQVNTAVETSDIENQLNQYLAVQNDASPDWPIASYKLEPLLDVAINAYKTNSSLSGSSSPPALIAFTLIGAFLLLVASFNYINVAIISGSRRLKEIGLRKVFGSSRLGIMKQFMGENLLICFLAVVAGVILAQSIFLPIFVTLTDKSEFPLSVFDTSDIWLILPAILLFTAVCGGAYPAFYISRFQPVNIFRGKLTIGGRSLLKSTMIVCQFIMTFMLLSLSVIVSRNAEYMTTVDWGYDQRDIITIDTENKQQYDILENAIRGNPNIITVAGTQNSFGGELPTEVIMYEGTQYEVKQVIIGAEYANMMKLRLEAGSLFDPEINPEASHQVVINEQFSERFGLERPIGTYIKIDSIDYAVIGVVENFHYRDFYEEIEPLVIRRAPEKDFSSLSVKYKAGTEIQTAELLNSTWKKLIPDKPYNSFFQDEVFEYWFYAERQIAKLFWSYAIIAITLSCMGLFGLVAVSITRRMKEVGIRKVLGAGMMNIINLMTKEYLILLTLSTVIAAPLSYYLVEAALDGIHAYHIPVSVTHMVFVIALIILTSVLTISSLLYKAGQTNPVDTLKYE